MTAKQATKLEAILWAATLAALILLACFIYARCGGREWQPRTATPADTTITDTIRAQAPVPRDTVYLRADTIRYAITRHHTTTRVTERHLTDTLIKVDTLNRYVTLPITTRTYRDSTFTAIVSGYNPRLDFIETYNKTVIRYFPKWKQPRLSVGIGAGLYATAKGLQPGIGVTLQYNILNIK